MTTRFETGRSYWMSSPCDSQCIWSFTVERRTESSVWLRDDEGKVVRRKISVWGSEEQAFPLGSYSMAPILGAGKIVLETV